MKMIKAITLIFVILIISIAVSGCTMLERNIDDMKAPEYQTLSINKNHNEDQDDNHSSTTKITSNETTTQVINETDPGETTSDNATINISNETKPPKTTKPPKSENTQTTTKNQNDDKTNPTTDVPSTLPAKDSIPISSRKELEYIGNNTAYPLNEKYHLTNNIDLGDKEWIPINGFTGIFDGQNYNIKNLFVLSTSNNTHAGLFGTVVSESKKTVIIKNLSVHVNSKGVTAVFNHESTLTHFSIVAAGGLIGACYSNNANSEILIENCYATGDIFSIATEAIYFPTFSYAGGLIGQVATGGGSIIIKRAYATGNIYASSDKDSAAAGGLVGGLEAWQNDGPIIIENCYATGNVTSSVSYSAKFRKIDSSAGGLVGRSDDIYCQSKMTIRNSYTTGEVAAQSVCDSSAGGIIGFKNNLTTVDSCYYLSDNLITDGLINHSGTSLSKTKMKMNSSFEKWDFSKIWFIEEGKSYPKLLIYIS